TRGIASERFLARTHLSARVADGAAARQPLRGPFRLPRSSVGAGLDRLADDRWLEPAGDAGRQCSFRTVLVRDFFLDTARAAHVLFRVDERQRDFAGEGPAHVHPLADDRPALVRDRAGQAVRQPLADRTAL